MATIKFQLCSEANKAVSIYSYLSMGRGGFFRIRTGFSIHPLGWSKVKGLPKLNDDANKKLISNLRTLEKYLLDSINEAQASGIEINAEFLEQKTNKCFNREKQTDISMVAYQVQYIIDHADTRKIIGKFHKHELIVSHGCRRSFCTNYYKIIPTTVIMGITGHIKESTFLQYINKPKDMDENAKLFLRYLTPSSP